MVHRVQVREISNDEGNRLLRIVRRSSGSVVTWRRSQMVLLSAQGMDVSMIAKVTFTSADRVRDVIHNFNADGFDSLYPKYAGGRPRTFNRPEHRESRRSRSPSRSSTVCRSRPGVCRNSPISWSPRGWSTTSPARAFGSCSVTRASPFNEYRPGRHPAIRTMRSRRPGSSTCTRRRRRGHT